MLTRTGRQQSANVRKNKKELTRASLFDNLSVFQQAECAESKAEIGQDAETDPGSKNLGSQVTTESKGSEAEEIQPQARPQGEIERQLEKAQTNQTLKRHTEDLSHQERSREVATSPSNQVTIVMYPC